MNRPTVSSLSIDQFKRMMLLTIIVLSLLSTAAGWAMLRANGQQTPALSRVQEVATFVLSGLMVAAWWKLLPQKLIELACLLFAVLMCAVCMALRMYWPDYSAGIRLQPLYLWIPVVYVFAFTLTDHKVGLVISLGILVLFVGVSLPYLLHGGDAAYGNLTLQLHFVSAVLIAALYYFSSYQYRLGSAQRAVDQLAHLSNTDELTQLSNRRHMAAVLNAALTDCMDHQRGFTVALFDVDHFKAINDEFGHGAGDRALKLLAARALQVFGTAESVGRWGGDEFVAVMRDVGSANALKRVEALRHCIAVGPLMEHRCVTISCGVTLAKSSDTIDSLLQRADAALYAAKRMGRDRVEFFGPAPVDGCGNQ